MFLTKKDIFVVISIFYSTLPAIKEVTHLICSIMLFIFFMCYSIISSIIINKLIIICLLIIYINILYIPFFIYNTIFKYISVNNNNNK